MTIRRRVSFEVFGIAQPKGSTKAFVPLAWAKAAVRKNQAPRAIITHDNTRTQAWQQLVADQAQDVAGDGLFLGALVVTVTFILPRPITLPRKVRHHVTLPDVDKLARSVLDALTGILYLDDKQVVDLHARKCYAVHAADQPRVRITVEAAAAPDPLQPELLADASLFALEAPGEAPERQKGA